jgi:hypothetical protein
MRTDCSATLLLATAEKNAASKVVKPEFSGSERKTGGVFRDIKFREIVVLF